VEERAVVVVMETPHRRVLADHRVVYSPVRAAAAGAVSRPATASLRLVPAAAPVCSLALRLVQQLLPLELLAFRITTIKATAGPAAVVAGRTVPRHRTIAPAATADTMVLAAAVVVPAGTIPATQVLAAMVDKDLRSSSRTSNSIALPSAGASFKVLVAEPT
jgi:hypothetical protein